MSEPQRDPHQIDWFLNHAVENIYPSREALRSRLLTGPRLTVYIGIDPTGDSIHLGHALSLKKLAELQKLGHRVILLIGDFTAMIGDPTDKKATRTQLTKEQVLENCRRYQAQASHILSFEGENAAQLKFNSTWLATMSFSDVVELSSHFTVQQMMERDMFEKRMEEGKPIHLHEFLYPLMQGYDSIALDVDLEIGGNDQTFNMLAGRTLMREMRQKEKCVLTCRLLTDSTGKKMGKSEGNAIALTDSADEIFGKVMSWTDEMLIPGFEICTDLSAEEIEDIKNEIAEGENPMKIKMRLGELIVSWLFHAEAAQEAREHFSRVHQQGEKPEVMKEIQIPTGEISLIDALVLSGLVDSKTEARRQIEQGAIKVNDVVVNDVKYHVRVDTTGSVIQKGKRFFIRLVV